MNAEALNKRLDDTPWRGDEASGPRAPEWLARGVAWLALALFGSLHWVAMVEPAAGRRALAAVFAGALVAAVCVAASRLASRLRAVASSLGLLGGFALALLAAGVPADLLRPAGWGTLTGELMRGAEVAPGVRIPYAGSDVWTATALLSGGTLLTVASAALAFWPRRHGFGLRIAALVALVALYAVPVVVMSFGGEFARGALLSLLVFAFLRLDRLGINDLSGALATSLAVAVLALVAAPALDREDPWFDYGAWATETAKSRSTVFSWDHDYGPLEWSRDGREMLRVKARFGTYWKADTLDLFDGTRWRRQPLPTRSTDPQLPSVRKRIEQWSQRIEVTVRDLRSRTFVTSGVPHDQGVEFTGRRPFTSGVSGIVSAPRTLRRGDTYAATVYAPRAPAKDLRRAGTYFEPWLRFYLQLNVTDDSSPTIDDRSTRGTDTAARTEISFGPYDSAETPVARSLRFVRQAPVDARDLLESGGMARTWDLAQRLLEQSDTQYDYVRAVERYLSRSDFSYAETPPPAAGTLDGFLFEAKAGFCQQYSGAMALLLRMGGVPARVATGFTSGTQDKRTREYVVRDLDAHSWVEAWFPGWGWIVFDPTPPAAPPRAQADRNPAAVAGIGDVSDLGAGDRLDPRTGSVPDASGGGGFPWLWAAVGLGAVGAVLARPGRRIRRRRDGRPRDAVQELEFALRRVRGPQRPELTLRDLEDSLGAGAEYVRTLRERRYSAASAAPTARQRRALRSELGRGSLLRRMRAWKALPPRLWRRLH